jgi:lipopolysaccharide/colanic/teichoic acid biosynthesis glycosyltransferase
LEELARDEGVQGIPIEMGRRMTPGSDVKALARLWWTFRKIRPAIVHGHTPRGGLLAMIAAFLAGVPVRVCTVQGRPLETDSGWKRMGLRWTERVSRLLANRVVSGTDDSRAAIERAYREGLERRSGVRAEAAPDAGSAGPSRSAEKGLKRIFDFSVALAALVLAAPVMGLIALGTWVTLGSPIFFRQVRPGLKGRPFVPLKFRTMRPGPEKDAQRMTTLGRLLRQFSLDELPQLWTVVRGDMSLVGPRPLLMSYLKRYTPRLLKRQDMRPGITGWCQVNGRNEVSWDRKFELDLWYVEHWSVLLDFKILFMTMRRVIRKPGDEGPGHHVWSDGPGPSAPPQEKTP